MEIVVFEQDRSDLRFGIYLTYKGKAGDRDQCQVLGWVPSAAALPLAALLHTDKRFKEIEAYLKGVEVDPTFWDVMNKILDEREQRYGFKMLTYLIEHLGKRFRLEVSDLVALLIHVSKIGGGTFVLSRSYVDYMHRRQGVVI